MSASFYDLLKYAKTGIASSDMTAFDKLRAQEMAGGKVKTLTGVPPLSFTGNGKPLISWSMKGNGQQAGTPSPDNIIMPEFCGKLVGTDWIIPITNAGQTTPIYLGQTQTLRRVKKLTFTGMEDWQVSAAWKKTNTSVFFYDKYDMKNTINKAEIYVLSDKFSATSRDGLYNGDSNMIAKTGSYAMTIRVSDSIATTVSAFKSWLALNPVTVWYILAIPTTGIVNEPLCKIGDYADVLNSADAAVTIPTARGSNTLTVGTDLQPSSMTITYR